MIETLRRWLGSGPRVDYAQLMKDGAIIVDVRLPGEYASGHIAGSINIAVDQLAGQLRRFKNKEQTMITCCASGMRSGAAKNILKSNGFTRVYNGGSWNSLQNKIK